VHRLTIFLASLVPATLFLAAPAHAQQSEGKVNALIVYGDDPCPQSTGDEITVCARKSESERYRIPESLRDSNNSPANRAWTDKVLAYETVGATGTLSCSAVGAGGMTGCLNKLIGSAYAEKRNDPNIRFSELIAAEREKRMATIDADAAATQARVEQIEREFDAKQRAQQDGDTAPSKPATPPALAPAGSAPPPPKP
jgi:hypothetical protein